MIRARDLTKRFGSFTAIEDVSFTVAGGEIVGFLGPNGAGKSTTLRILAGVFPPTSGLAEVAGHDVVREPLAARAVVGYFPERVSLYLDMTVAHYLRWVGEMKGLGGAELRRGVAEALAGCALEPVAGRLIGTMSKGFRQRIGIAQAMVAFPRVLILDEPTAGLDPEQVADVRELIRKLRGERTVILSTHILSEVEATCDRVIILHRGRVLAVDTAANLSRRLRRGSQFHLEVRGHAAAAVRALEAVAGVSAVELTEMTPEGGVCLTVDTFEGRDLREALAAAVLQGGFGLRELRPVTLSLEEIFLSLVAAEPRAQGEADEVSGNLPA